MLTVADIQTSTFQTASGVPTNTPQFFSIINEVVPRLLKRGDWFGTLLPVRVCMKNGCVTWPRYVGQVRRLADCKQNIPVKSQWYEFMFGNRAWGRRDWDSWCGRERMMKLQYKAPTYNDIYGPNCAVRIYPMVKEDIGATVTLFGTDNNNQPLTTNNGDGTWSEGITISVNVPFGSTSNPYFVSHIDRVVKSKTQGNLLMYAYDTVNDVLFDLAVYEPSETNPSYLRYQLEGDRYTGWYNQNGCNQTIIALVKLRFIPVSAPTDLLLINDIGALKQGVLAWKQEESNNFEASKQWWAGAVESLNRELEDSQPDDQLPAINQVFGGAVFCNKQF
jgi:hypothetical protein